MNMMRHGFRDTLLGQKKHPRPMKDGDAGGYCVLVGAILSLIN